MPSLGIAIFQPCLQNLQLQSRSHNLVRTNALRNPWISSKLPQSVEFYTGKIRKGNLLLITAIATLEPKCQVHTKDGQNSSQLVVGPILPKDENGSGESEKLNESEWLRRTRISKANKGNKPWNKGRKHSPETLQRIRERTKLAMQNPKIRMKLANLGHAQTEETRMKIGQAVRMTWEKKREEQMEQEACCFQWQNLVAEASRRGNAGEQELQWDSYKLLREQLSKEWSESNEEKKTMPKLKYCRRAPKSPEQRRRIAEAIAAKWADPEYRERVVSSLAKRHGSNAGAERKPKRKPSNGTREFTSQRLVKKITSDTSLSYTSPSRNQIQQLRLKRSKTTKFKDPMASSKLNMIKNIRAERAAAESKRIEVIAQARLLIAEAEKAAKALEVAAMKSPIAQASLTETKKLIAEAINSIESIESGKMTSSNETVVYPSGAPHQDFGQLEKHQQSEARREPGFAKLATQNIVNGDNEIFSSGFGDPNIPALNLHGAMSQSILTKQLGQSEPNGNTEWEKTFLPNGTKLHLLEPNGNTGLGNIEWENNPVPDGNELHSLEQQRSIKYGNVPLLSVAKTPAIEKAGTLKAAVTVTKKWVRGRLVEVPGDA